VKVNLFFTLLSTSYFTTIEYQDDLEVDLFMSLSSSVSYGAHYPISMNRSIRMLTHRGYALSSSILTAESIPLQLDLQRNLSQFQLKSSFVNQVMIDYLS